DAWIAAINRRPGRGSEWDKARAIFEARGAEELRLPDLLAIYAAELREGKPWSVHHDLYACGVALSAPFAGAFEARFDRICFTSSGLALFAVREPLSVAQRRRVYEQGDVLPNAWQPSDHLPLAALFRWSPSGS